MFIIYLLILLSYTQEAGKVKGRIINEDSTGAYNVLVLISNASVKVTTDSAGYFEMDVPTGKHTLITLFMGFRSTKIPIKVQPDSTLDLGTFILGSHYFITHNQITGEPILKTKANNLKNTIVTPHLEQKIEHNKNVLWCGTFQLAWNEFCDLAGGPIKVKPTSTMVDILNKRKTQKEDLDEKDYVAMAGKGKSFVAKIFAELDRKFEGQASPDLLKKHAQTDINWITYAYLLKQLPFKYTFHRHYNELTFQGTLIDYFGLPTRYGSPPNLTKIAEQVTVLDYKNNDDFIVELKTTAENDQLILAKIPSKETLLETVKNVERRILKGKSSKLTDEEIIRVPVLDFDMLREYNELCGDTILAKDKDINGTTIDIAAQSIRFKLDEKGAVLKSEGIMISIGASTLEIRSFIFDKPFLILLKRRNAENPYFTLWVGNTELLVSTEQD